MKKYIKYIIILGFITLGIVLINHYFSPNIDDQIIDYLQEKGYSKSKNNLLVKQENNRTLSFSSALYTFMLNVDEDKNDMNMSTNATYDFKNESLVYTYRIRYSNSVNVIFKGIYNDNNFICEKEFSTGTLSSDDIKTICSLAEYNIKIFKLEANTLFTKYKYIQYMKNKEL